MTFAPSLNALLLSLACLILTGCSTAPSVSVETLLKTSQSWEGTRYKSYPAGQPELTVLKITLAPKTTLDWHTHPIPNAAYVLSGQLLLETKNGHTLTVKEGQVLPEVVNIPHRGTSGNMPVELIVFYAGSVGMPLSK